MNHKENPLEDAKKAQWYLNRLVKQLEEKAKQGPSSVDSG